MKRLFFIYVLFLVFFTSCKKEEVPLDGNSGIISIIPDAKMYFTKDMVNWVNIKGSYSNAKIIVGDFNGDKKDDLASIVSDGKLYYTVDLQNWINIPGKFSNLYKFVY